MGSEIKLLIVDDEERFLETLSKRLSLRDFDVTTATNGADALDLAKTNKFDLALVDLKMPGMSGEEVLVALKEQHPLVEVVILTGHGSIDSAVQCTSVGSFDYLQKPCETEELLEVLKKAYQRRVELRLKKRNERLEEVMGEVMQHSPLGILRRLREIDEELG